MSQRTGLPLLKEAESLRLKAYLCPAGVPTIGYGSTKGVKMGMSITSDQAESMVIEEYDEFEDGVLSLVRAQLTENQLGALTSFAYNVGLGNLRSSTLLKLVNKGDFEGAAKRFMDWTKAKVNGTLTVLPGLVKRRTKEAKLFLS